jgi:hypothetical protein
MRALHVCVSQCLTALMVVAIAAPLFAQSAPPLVVPVDDPAQPEVKMGDLGTIQQILGKDLAKTAEIVRDIWKIEIVSKPSVTVGTLLGGIVLLALAYLGSSMISRWVARKLLAHFGVSKNCVQLSRRGGRHRRRFRQSERD